MAVSMVPVPSSFSSRLLQLAEKTGECINGTSRQEIRVESSAGAVRREKRLCFAQNYQAHAHAHAHAPARTLLFTPTTQESNKGGRGRNDAPTCNRYGISWMLLRAAPPPQSTDRFSW